jgi:hypothetical protein
VFVCVWVGRYECVYIGMCAKDEDVFSDMLCDVEQVA